MTNQSQDNKRIAYNTILLYIRMLFLVLISLYTSRVVLKVLGIEDYGINNVVAGIITVLSFITSSLSGASSRFITFALGKGDFFELKRVFNNIVCIHILFAITILIIGETIGLWFIMNKLNIPENRQLAAFWVYQFSIITAMGSFISMPYNAAIIAHEKMSTFAYLTIGDAILKLIAVYLLTILPYDKLIMYAGMILCIQLFDFAIYIIYCNKMFPETKIKSFKIEKNTFKEIFSYAGWTMNGSLAVLGYTQGLNILLNIFFNPTINAARGIAVQVQSIVNNFSTNFQMAINPQLTKNYATGDYDRMHELIILSSKFSVFLLLIICIPIILEIEIILKWWLNEYPENACLFLRLILITSIQYSLANPIITSIHAVGQVKKFQLIEASLLLTIVPISYLFLKYFNTAPQSVFIIHILIETITQIARIYIVLPKIKMSKKKYLNQVIKPIILVGIFSPIAPTITFLFFNKDLLSFILVITISTFSTICFTYLFGCNRKEQKIIQTKVKTLFLDQKSNCNI